jgi:hypothetical protein
VAFWGTGWLYYTVFEPAMSHVYDVFTLALFVAVGLRAMEAGGVARGAAGGLAAGLHVLVRPQNLATVAIVCAAVVALAWARARWRLDRGRLGQLAGFGLCFAAALAPLALSNQALFGSMLAVPQGGEFLDLARPRLLDILFSGRNGLFSHHPVLLLAVGGWVALAVAGEPRRRAALGLLAPLGMALAVQLWINASVVDWWGGHAFGQRRLLSGVPAFAIGLCALAALGLDRGRRGRIAVWAVAAAAVLLNLELTAIHVFLWEYNEPHDVVHWLFVRGPRAIWSRLLRL